MKKEKIIYASYTENNKTYMICKSCQVEYVEIGDPDVVAVTCPHCVQRRCLALQPMDSFFSSRRTKTGRPPGWQWMTEYVDKDGNVFHKGEEQPKLKGTLKPTKVKPRKIKPRLSADEKLFQRAKEHKRKKKLQRKASRNK